MKYLSVWYHKCIFPKIKYTKVIIYDKYKEYTFCHSIIYTIFPL